MFRVLENIEGSIVAYTDAMRVLATDNQNFQASGYKSTRSSFMSLFTQQIYRLGGSAYFGGHSSSSSSISSGVSFQPLGLNWTQGGLQGGNSLDAAIVGSGTYVLKSSNIQGYLLTRASSFSFDSNGFLVDQFNRQVQGYPSDANGDPDKTKLISIQVDVSTTDVGDVGFLDGGILTDNYTAVTTALDDPDVTTIPAGKKLFHLALARVPNPGGLDVFSGGAFRISSRSGGIVGFGVSGDAAFGDIVGRSQEGSNINPAETTIIGIEYQRGYNAVQGVLTLANKMLQLFMQSIEKVIG